MVGKGTPTWQSSFLESAGFYENWFCPPVPYHQHSAHSDHQAGLHKLWYPGIRDTSTWSKFGEHGEHGDVSLFSNIGAL